MSDQPIRRVDPATAANAAAAAKAAATPTPTTISGADAAAVQINDAAQAGAANAAAENAAAAEERRPYIVVNGAIFVSDENGKSHKVRPKGEVYKGNVCNGVVHLTDAQARRFDAMGRLRPYFPPEE